MRESNFVPVKKVLTIINSCETVEQLESTLSIIDNYVKQVKKKGLVNTGILRKRLMKEYNQKVFQVKMIASFLERDKKEFSKEINKEVVNIRSKNNLKINA